MGKFQRLMATTAVSAAIFTGTAQAETGTVEFIGSVDSSQVATCTIEATKIGALQIGDDFKTLTSKTTTAGRVKVRANADNYKVTVSGPTDGAFKTEPADNKALADNTQTFAAFYTPLDVNNAPTTEVAGSTPTELVKNVELKAEVDLVVSQTQDYAPGNYAAEVVVTCE